MRRAVGEPLGHPEQPVVEPAQEAGPDDLGHRPAVEQPGACRFGLRRGLLVLAGRLGAPRARLGPRLEVQRRPTDGVEPGQLPADGTVAPQGQAAAGGQHHQGQDGADGSERGQAAGRADEQQEGAGRPDGAQPASSGGQAARGRGRVGATTGRARTDGGGQGHGVSSRQLGCVPWGTWCGLYACVRRLGKEFGVAPGPAPRRPWLNGPPRVDRGLGGKGGAMADAETPRHTGRSHGDGGCRPGRPGS